MNLPCLVKYLILALFLHVLGLLLCLPLPFFKEELWNWELGEGYFCVKIPDQFLGKIMKSGECNHSIFLFFHWFSLYRGCTNKTKRRGNKIQIFLPDTLFACARGRVWLPLPRSNYTPDQTDSKHGYHDVHLWSCSLLTWWIAVWQGGRRWKTERLEWATECQCQCGGLKEHCIRSKQLWTKQKVDCGQLWIILLPLLCGLMSVWQMGTAP